MMAILQEAQPPDTKDDELEMLLTAEKLETDHPLWIVVFGVYSRQFVAFPRFSVPAGTMATAHYPGALAERMRRMELAAGAGAETEKRDTAGREVG